MFTCFKSLFFTFGNHFYQFFAYRSSVCFFRYRCVHIYGLISIPSLVYFTVKTTWHFWEKLNLVVMKYPYVFEFSLLIIYVGFFHSYLWEKLTCKFPFLQRPHEILLSRLCWLHSMSQEVLLLVYFLSLLMFWKCII